MKRLYGDIVRLLCMGLLGGVFSACSPTDVDRTVLDDEFRQLVSCMEAGLDVEGRGYAVGKRIAELADDGERRRCLEAFGRLVLSRETGGVDDGLLGKRAGRRRDLLSPYLYAAERCGVSFTERMGFRMAFVKWLRDEGKRRVSADVPENAGRASGLHWTEGMYLGHLAQLEFVCLRELERMFVDRMAGRDIPTDEISRLRPRLEAFLGHPVRTLSEIDRAYPVEWERLMRKVKDLERRGVQRTES